MADQPNIKPDADCSSRAFPSPRPGMISRTRSTSAKRSRSASRCQRRGEVVHDEAMARIPQSDSPPVVSLAAAGANRRQSTRCHCRIHRPRVFRPSTLTGRRANRCPPPPAQEFPDPDGACPEPSEQSTALTPRESDRIALFASSIARLSSPPSWSSLSCTGVRLLLRHQ